jgi:hypothetical protein
MRRGRKGEDEKERMKRRGKDEDRFILAIRC